MKKYFAFVGALLLLAFYGCQNADTQSNAGSLKNAGESLPAGSDVSSAGSSQVQKLNIGDYFPIRENVRYIYQGSGNEYASYNIYIDYTSGNSVQQRIDNGGTVAARVIRLQDGKIVKTVSRAEAYYRENLIEAAGEEEVLLMEPLEIGTAWTLKDNRTRTITNVAADVTVGQGSYKAIEVTTQGTDDQTIEYYAPNIGLVKSVFIAGGAQITSSLDKIEENAALTQKIGFYYPNRDNKIACTYKDIRFKSNDITRQILESAYKRVEDGTFKAVLAPDVKINSLYLNRDLMVYINLSGAFITDMNSRPGDEQAVLQCIANTFGAYYNSDKMILTVDSRPYRSEHITLQQGEYIKVKAE